MLCKIVWQGLADNKPSKTARQSTVYIWFDPQDSFTIWRTDCGSTYSSVHPICGRRCFYFLPLGPHSWEIHISREQCWLFSLLAVKGRGEKSEQILPFNMEILLQPRQHWPEWGFFLIWLFSVSEFRDWQEGGEISLQGLSASHRDSLCQSSA